MGHFDTVQEAAQAYDLEQVRRHGSKAQLNLPHLRWAWVQGINLGWCRRSS